MLGYCRPASIHHAVTVLESSPLAQGWSACGTGDFEGGIERALYKE